MNVQAVPTIKDIARQLNVSTSTVSRALNGHTSIGLRTRMRVEQLAREMSYTPNLNAISFKQRKTGIIGIVVPNLREDFFSEAISGIEEYVLQHKYHVLVGQSHDDAERESQLVEAMKSQRVDGLIVSLSKHTTNYEPFLSLRHYHIPLVFFDRVPNRPDVNKVLFNMRSGTREAIEFLYDKGHRRIALLNGPECMPSTKERVNVYKEIMIKKRIKIDMSLVVSTDMTPAATMRAMDELMVQKPRPTAVLAMNDYVALDVIQYIKNANLKVNRDITVISYANLPLTNYLETPPLASVEQYPFVQGTKAAEIMMELINHTGGEDTRPNHHIIIDGKLIVHERRKRA